MHASTEDLLKIRDGEPVDASMRVAVEQDPGLQAEVERLRQTQRALQGLPAFEPPPGVWERVQEHIGVETGAPVTSRWHWPLRGAIAASVAVLAVVLLTRSPEPPVVPQTTAAAPSTTVAQDATDNGLARSFGTPTYASLMTESARLERMLGGITYQPRLVNASTASTITGLEDRIALIDERLMYARVSGLQPRQAEAYWRERVDLMNALVQVRYAQAQRFGF